MSLIKVVLLIQYYKNNFQKDSAGFEFWKLEIYTLHSFVKIHFFYHRCILVWMHKLKLKSWNSSNRQAAVWQKTNLFEYIEGRTPNMIHHGNIILWFYNSLINQGQLQIWTEHSHTDLWNLKPVEKSKNHIRGLVVYERPF